MIIDSSVKKLMQEALREDIGSGDITTDAISGKTEKGKFVILARERAVISGLDIAEAVFKTVDSKVDFKPLTKDGAYVASGKEIAHLDGRCRSVLAAERTALNFLGWLSGVSSLTSRFVKSVEGTQAKIMDTRKTIPIFRNLQKYAVKMGGGTNHRMGLDDQILIKDNHIASIMAESLNSKAKKVALVVALEAVNKNVAKEKKIEVEVDSLEMLETVLSFKPDIIMLDNMKVDDIKLAVKQRDDYRLKFGDLDSKLLLEASGGINIGNVKSIAKTGVDRISVGALTHSAPSVDISLEVI